MGAEDLRELESKLTDLLNAGPVPRIVVFDLDYTCWPMWIDTHCSGPPFAKVRMSCCELFSEQCCLSQ